MTKKDYIIIAKVLKAFISKYANGGYSVNQAHSAYPKCDMFEALCQELKKDNPKFNAEMFMKACGLLQKCPYCTKYPCSNHDGSKYE